MRLPETFFFTLVLSFLGFSLVAAEVFFIPAPVEDKDPNVTYENLLLSTERQANIKAVLITVSKPVGFTHTVPANPETGCAPHAGTDKIGEAWGCSLAVNAGPFDMSKGGGCMGSLIANGTVYQIDDESGFASWGMTADGRYVFGDVNSSTVDEEGVVELVSGFIGPLLVQDGAAIHSGSALIAQRTAVGVDAEGRMLLLIIDGAESRDRGMNITELGDAFVELGAVYALNLDGGGSTTAWMDGEGFIDRPTCTDNILPECVRHVASAVCVMPGLV